MTARTGSNLKAKCLNTTPNILPKLVARGANRMNDSRRHLASALLILALGLLSLRAESRVKSCSLEKIFNSATFDSHFPLEEELVKTYGEGCTKKAFLAGGIEFPHHAFMTTSMLKGGFGFELLFPYPTRLSTC